MIINSNTIQNELALATYSSLRENMGGIEYQQANGAWKSLASHYNATFFATLFVENNFAEPGDYLLYGVGDGQIITELLTQKPTGKLYILETNMDILRLADERFSILEMLAADEDVVFCGSADITIIKEFLAQLPEDSLIRYYQPEIAAVPQELEFLTKWLTNRMIDKNSGVKHNHEIDFNVDFNEKKGIPNFLELFKGAFTGKPVLILLAGPSLRETLPQIAAYLDSFFFISVGRNGDLCEEYGIVPDLWIELDPVHRPELWSRLKSNDPSAPLVIMDSTSYQVHDYFAGMVAMVRSKMEHDDELALTTGKSTVAAFALDLAIEMGLGPIFLAGQDLCYIDGKSHLTETSRETGRHITENTPKLLCNDGVERFTSRVFLRHRESIESVLRERNIQCYTLSEKGAVIEGASYAKPESMKKMADHTIVKDELREFLSMTLSGKES